MSSSVSVVIPAYNYGHYVAEAVDSVLQQTFPPLEVIVVDDGSTDDTRARLAPFGSRIRYIHQDNRGLSGARNTGIRAAKGEWIAFLDADDRWHREKLAAQFRAIGERPDLRLVGGPARDDMPNHLPLRPPIRTLGVRDLLAWLPLGSSSALVHASCFESVGVFDEGLRSVEDRDMWLRIVVRFPVAQVDLGDWWYRQHPEQMNRNPERMHENFTRVLAGFFARHPEYRAHARFAWAYLFMDSGYSFFSTGDRKTGLRFLLRSLWLHPGALSDAPRRRLVRLKILSRLLLGEELWRAIKRPGS